MPSMSLLTEFKAFLFRGHLIELAVAFVMGLAFVALVNSLVANLVMPVIAAIVGKPDFRDLTFTINDAVFRYGAFLTDAIQFVFFFIVKPVDAMRKRARRSSELEAEAPSDEERRHQELLVAVRSISR
jgi:large conductance mechanosensitive channel